MNKNKVTLLIITNIIFSLATYLGLCVIAAYSISTRLTILKAILNLIYYIGFIFLFCYFIKQAFLLKYNYAKYITRQAPKKDLDDIEICKFYIERQKKSIFLEFISYIRKRIKKDDYLKMREIRKEEIKDLKRLMNGKITGEEYEENYLKRGEVIIPIFKRCGYIRKKGN